MPEKTLDSSSEMIWMKTYWTALGIIPGQDRARGHEKNERKTHLYEAQLDAKGKRMLMFPLRPMCFNGYNGTLGGFSIWRNQVGPKGICKTCIKNALSGEDGVD